VSSPGLGSVWKGFLEKKAQDLSMESLSNDVRGRGLTGLTLARRKGLWRTAAALPPSLLGGTLWA
jgi:hypothetical protein